MSAAAEERLGELGDLTYASYRDAGRLLRDDALVEGDAVATFAESIVVHDVDELFGVSRVEPFVLAFVARVASSWIQDLNFYSFLFWSNA